MRLLALLTIGLFLLAPRPAAADCTSPAKAAGEIIFNSDHAALQYCNGTDWVPMGKPVGNCDPANSPLPGEVCRDGSIYAGLSPDGDVPMYATPADAGLLTWNDGSTNYVDTAMQNCSSNGIPGAETSCRTGRANTDLLVALGSSPSPAPYVAAFHCDNLVAYGHSDWYLPAQDELYVLWLNRVQVGGFNLSAVFPAGWYSSSSEVSGQQTKTIRFSPFGEDNVTDKQQVASVRCVRKGYVPDEFGAGCTSPTASAGKIIYNTDQNLMQYCNGAQWVAMGKPSAGGPGCTAPSRDEGAIIYNSTCSVMQYCNGAEWVTIGKSANNGCECGNPLPGAVCADGIVYVGLAPDGVPVYTTPTHSPTKHPFDDGVAGNDPDLSLLNLSYDNGPENTAKLVAADASTVAGFQNHRAAHYCNNLVAHGYSDWYLTATNELLTAMCPNRSAIGGMPGGFELYWSSHTPFGGQADTWLASSTSCGGGGSSAHASYFVRCFRR